ncbi:glycosyltransferase family 1 protein [Phanerochaete carnosa HHB-10118-sp]|uniref:sterol 3beta-glucosyltransferase n=1 Tax=Phanerochaete carnosa (strain HHB-10118-sp) TaxID=650164 RepID=K5WN20_PHACS|nr:glycosyltransferase family 1 protein [Phanerochaete carnosa HHB-10118-sp]EKM60815.1 glycosyltransferase family 1 protein [Phanerochaete carnosa HHB-10118-sp]
MASSIHTIYRPLARSRRERVPATRSKSGKLSSVSDAEDEPAPEEPVVLEEELEDDFEQTVDRFTPGPEQGMDSPRMPLSPLPELDFLESNTKSHPSRSGSMATVKLQRRARLAEKLREVFDVPGIQEVIAEMPCWLLRSILLQGYMYLTDSCLCFFAHMPSREDQVLKSGWLSKRATRTKRWIKHWFILKNDVLSWYQSSSDPYFPHGVADLRYAITCEPTGERDIRIRTNQRTIKLSADSVPSRDEWVKAIRKVMFKAQNSGDSVKIAIPYSAIVDVEKSSAMDFSETIEVKAVDKNEAYSIDSYFFAYFHDLPAALEQIRDAVRAYRSAPGGSSSPPVIDTTVSRVPQAAHQLSQSPATLPPVPQVPKSPSHFSFRFTSLLRPLQDSLPLMRGYSAPGYVSRSPENEEYTHVSRKSGSCFVPITTPPAPIQPPSLSGPRSPGLTPTSPNFGHAHTYPPSTSASFTSAPASSLTSKESSTWAVGVPTWLKTGSKKLLSSASFATSLGGLRLTVEHSASAPPATGPGVSEILSTQSHLSESSSGDFGYFSILETPETAMDEETIEKFRTAFAFDEKEKLLGCFQGYIFRLLPVYGRLYISSSYFAFRSSGPLTSRTTMILPIRDILSTQPTKAFRFGHHGLVVIVRGHEELFFEFSDELRRAAFVRLLEKQIEEVRHHAGSGDATQPTTGELDALILEEFGPRTSVLTDAEPVTEPDGMDSSLPAVMFTSTSSTFLTFKPNKSLHFTFLTIGSRGDVQPYIALAKGLMADGHRARIATHGEFKEWVESHGIEFGYVGGDPAELMRICVENGTFTVAFLREGMQKFRGWIDDLLKTSWEACQGTDVLVESPSAMGGIHIAEALRIPYFRAFTMPWSRTRAYPHAFAVPEHRMGGNYNYMTYVLFDQVFWRGTAGQVNRWRRHTLGLPSTSLDKMEPHKVPFLYNFSPVVVPQPLDWPEWIRISGYWFLDDASVSSQKWIPPPDLVEFIANAHKENKKVVYIGFGSIVVSDPKAMTRCVIDAIVQSGVYAILSKGWSDRLVKNVADAGEPPEPLPKQIYPISSIPHDWLFKRVDAACHHGGAGTTGASLRAGIPTIIKPFFGDQYFWADRVEALGVGSAVRKLTVQSLTDALITATTDQKQVQRAKEIGEQIRAENGVATAIEAIYRDLEYARSLIKGLPHEDETDLSTLRGRPTHSRSNSSPGHKSTHSSASSAHGGTISDWSVISDQED